MQQSFGWRRDGRHDRTQNRNPRRLVRRNRIRLVLISYRLLHEVVILYVGNSLGVRRDSLGKSRDSLDNGHPFIDCLSLYKFTCYRGVA